MDSSLGSITVSYWSHRIISRGARLLKWVYKQNICLLANFWQAHGKKSKSKKIRKYILVSFFCWQLLGDMLLDRSNSSVMMRYVSSKDNLKVLMDLLKVGILLSNFSFFIFLLLLFTQHNLEHKYMHAINAFFLLFSHRNPARIFRWKPSMFSR